MDEMENWWIFETTTIFIDFIENTELIDNTKVT